MLKASYFYTQGHVDEVHVPGPLHMQNCNLDTLHIAVNWTV